MLLRLIYVTIDGVTPTSGAKRNCFQFPTNPHLFVSFLSLNMSKLFKKGPRHWTLILAPPRRRRIRRWRRVTDTKGMMNPPPPSLISVLVLLPQILGPFGPPKKRVNFYMLRKDQKYVFLYFDPQSLNQNKVLLPYCVLFRGCPYIT